MTTPRFDLAEVRQTLGPTASYLGTGSFGETYRVGSEAVKVIHTDAGVRLDREVASLNRVSHGNVVRLLREETLRLGGKERVALRFEYINGPNIADKVAAGALLPGTDFTAFAAGLLRGLEALHSEGIIHRDIKPANVALRAGEWSQPVILDLGLAKLLDLGSITNYPALVGTAIYMAPEQLTGARVRKVADVFSTGTLIYEAVTGQHPFVAPNAYGMTHSDLIAAVRAGPDATKLGSLADAQRAVLLQMLSHTEYQRGTAKSLVRALEGMTIR